MHGDQLELGNLVFNDGSRNAVLQLNPATGNVSTNAQIEFDSSGGLCLETDGKMVVMHAIGGYDPHPEFICIDTTTGQQTILPDAQLMIEGEGMDMGADGNLRVSGHALLYDPVARNYTNIYGLFSVNPTNGQQTLIASNSHPLAWGIVVAPNSDIYVIENSSRNSLLRFRPSGSVWSVISTGGNLQFPEGLALDANGNVLVADANTHSVIRIAPNGGSQTIVSSGNNLAWPRGITVAPNGDIFVTDILSKKVLRIDPGTGAQSVLATNLGPEDIRFIDKARPRLGIRGSNGMVALSWTKAAINYHLEGSSQLFPLQWLTITNATTESTWQQELSLPVVPAFKFFRLRNN
jgi:sugar lactone lactonase YvrE